MVAKKKAPLANIGNVRRLLQDFSNRFAVFQFHSHEHARHEGKVEGHVKLVAIRKICAQISRPLVGLCQQHAPWELLI